MSQRDARYCGLHGKPFWPEDGCPVCVSQYKGGPSYDELEARLRAAEQALQRIADWDYEPHDISVQEYARRAVGGNTP